MKALLLGVVKPVVRVARTYMSRRLVNRMQSRRGRVLLEIGAGDRGGRNGWLTMDVTRNCDIYWDLRKGIPFEDNRVSKLYSSHFLEHLTFKEAQQFLKECRRVLEIGGTISVCVPNAKIYAEAYLKNIELKAPKYFGYAPAYNNTTRIDYLNYMAYMDGHHKYMFDEENLLHILTTAGFKDARLRQFEPELDLRERDFESIYAEATK